MHSGSIVFYIKSIRDKKNFLQDMRHSRKSTPKKTFHCHVVELLYLLYITTVHQMLGAPSVCDVESLCTSNNLHFRSKHHKISLAWSRNVFILLKFICSYTTKPTTPKDTNFVCGSSSVQKPVTLSSDVKQRIQRSQHNRPNSNNNYKTKKNFTVFTPR